MSPGMRFLGPAPGWRHLSSSHAGREEQEGPHEHPPGFLQLLDEGRGEHRVHQDQQVTAAP